MVKQECCICIVFIYICSQISQYRRSQIEDMSFRRAAPWFWERSPLQLQGEFSKMITMPSEKERQIPGFTG